MNRTRECARRRRQLEARTEASQAAEDLEAQEDEIAISKLRTAVTRLKLTIIAYQGSESARRHRHAMKSGFCWRKKKT
jgi:hypothetical protein